MYKHVCHTVNLCNSYHSCVPSTVKESRVHLNSYLAFTALNLYQMFSYNTMIYCTVSIKMKIQTCTCKYTDFCYNKIKLAIITALVKPTFWKGFFKRSKQCICTLLILNVRLCRPRLSL